MTDIVKNNKPAVVRGIFWVFDIFAAASILALAILGASRFVETATKEVKLGVAVAVVGLLASRLVERIFDARR